MRDKREPQATMLAFEGLKERVLKDHPLRTIKVVAYEGVGASVCGVPPDVLKGGPGVRAPERLLKHKIS